MNISDILTADLVLTDVEVENKRQLLKILADKVSKISKTDSSVVFEALLERENLGSTGYGKKVAFPHARIENIDKVYVVFARLHRAVDFDSSDAQEVDLVACLVSPEDSGEDHLQILAAFSRIFDDDEICRKIRNAKTAGEICSLLIAA